MKNIINLLAVTLTTAALVVSAHAADLVNVAGASNIAVGGYDTVAFFTDHKAVNGDPFITATYQGATYIFASKEHKDLFKADPAKYTPEFGGYCAYGVSRNKLVEIDVDAFQIVDGKLLLQYSKGVRDDFNKDPKANLAKANANWTGLVAKKGK